MQQDDATATDCTTRKHFVLDTNVLLHNPNAIYMFAEHEVVVPLTVLEELDPLQEKQR